MERKGSMRCCRVAVLGNRPVMHAVRLLSPGHLTEFLILEEGTMKLCGIMGECEMVNVYLDNPGCMLREACASLNGKKGR